LFDDVENLVEKTGQKTPPVKPEKVAKERKVIEIERATLDTDALIVPCKGGFLMKINDKLPVVMQRFACAHEIAHTYFFDLEKDPPCKPYRRSTSRYWVEEKNLNISVGNLKGEIASFDASYMGSYPPKVVAILCLRRD